MIDLNVINSYLVIGVVLGCCGIGFDFIPNKYIPFIMAVLGVVLNIAISKSFDMNIFLGGLLSGLSSVGLHQSFKALIENK
mgnify:CR=1 FL=1